MSRPSIDWDAIFEDPEAYSEVFAYRFRLLESIRDETPTEYEGIETTVGQVRLASFMRHYATREGLLDFVEDWCVTYDPRRAERGLPPAIPFVLFERQRELLFWFLDRLENREEGVVEKSREVGATWLCAAFAVWLWLFREGASVGFGSHKLEYVDELGNPKSILEKIRIILRYLPKEFRPAGYDERRDALHKRIVNPETGSTIIGEGGDEIGRAGRMTCFFVDEASLAKPSVEASLSETSRVKFWVSTVRGLGNLFARKRFSGAFDVFEFDWRDDPRKNEEWYARRCRELDPVTVAQEIDRDYHAAVENAVIPGKWIKAAQEIAELTDWPEFSGGIAGLDVGGGGQGLSVFLARFGPFVDPPVSRRGSDTTETALWAMDHAWKSGVDRLHFDPIGVGAGVSSTLKRKSTWEPTDPDTGQAARTKDGRKVTFRIPTQAVAGGDRPSYRLWPDGRRANEKFHNLRAELWWTMRDRFQATYEHLLFLRGEEGGHEHPLEDLLVLPPKGSGADVDALVTQLSIPTWLRSQSGKIIIESKEKMRARGVPSPDHADSLALTFADTVDAEGGTDQRLSGGWN